MNGKPAGHTLSSRSGGPVHVPKRSERSLCLVPITSFGGLIAFFSFLGAITMQWGTRSCSPCQDHLDWTYVLGTEDDNERSII